jgi:glycosyltransferase involved in cell wall biosynthesis
MTETKEKKPKLSVVVATYNRAGTLALLVDHLAKQDIEPHEYEVIIVDDGSPDNTQQVMEEMLCHACIELIYLRHENHGIGYAQNRGIRAARGELVLLIPDDILLSPGALREHIDFHRKNPEPEVSVIGNVIQSTDLNQSVFLKKWDPFRFSELDGLNELRPYRYGACNISFKKDFMAQFGMFLEHRPRGGAVAMEDFEVGYRLEKHGMRLLYAPNALGYHYHVTTLDSAVDRWYERGLNYEEFRKHATHPELTVYFHILNFRTMREYFRVLQGPNSFQGREKSIVWHIFRHCIRLILLNRLTARWIWRPILDKAESNRLLAALMNRQLYRAFLYYHFIKGVHDARRIYGDK